MRQILDEQSGEWFSNFVTTNATAAAAATDRTRLAEGRFGVFGVKSLYAPERTLRQTYRLKIGQPGDPPNYRSQTLRNRWGLAANIFPEGATEPSTQAYSILEQVARTDAPGQVDQPIGHGIHE